jgi:hypothetical protein
MEINKAEEIVEEILSVVTRWPEFESQAHVSPDSIKYVGDLHLSKKKLSKSSR